MSHTVILTDDADEFDWQQIIETYDENEVLVRRQTMFDPQPGNAILFLDERFVGGELTSQVWTDTSWSGPLHLSPPGGQHDWLQQTTEYGINGYDAYVVTLMDSPLDPTDGVGPQLNDAGQAVTIRITQGYLGGTLRYELSEDVAILDDQLNTSADSDLEDWASIEQWFDVSGALTQRETSYDSGLTVREMYDDGVLTSMLEADMPFESGGQFDWEVRETLFYPDGTVANVTTLFDDLLLTSEGFVDGVLRSRIVSDIDDPGRGHLPPGTDVNDDLKGWRSVEYLYDATGVLEQKITEWDNGIVVDEGFDAAGNLLSQVKTDAEDAKWWTTVESIYDEDGNLVEKTVTHDNGLVTTTTFNEFGNPVVSKTDVADQFWWNTFETAYDENGDVSLQLIGWDDGGYEFREWTDGVLWRSYKSDLGQSHGWHSVEAFYDEDGDLATKIITYDDFVTATETWQDGVRLSVLKEDGADQFWWSTIEMTYNVNGDVLSKLVVADNGIATRTNYADSGRVVLQSDDADIFGWSFRSTAYDVNGDPLMGFVEYDNGVSVYNEWTAGVLTMTVKEDREDAKWWTTVTLTYDENGNLVEKETVHDNGTIITETYVEGALKNKLQWDQGDVRGWDSILTIYENDLPSVRFTVMDDGTHVNEGFVDGVVNERFTHDMGFLHDWERIEEYYFATGDTVYRKLTYYDNGVLEGEAHGADGFVGIEQEDLADVFDWDLQGVLFNPDGDLTESFVFMDNRELFYDLYDEGVLELAILEDIGGLHEWYARVEFYDDTGALVDTQYYDSADDLEDATGYRNDLFIMG